MEPNNIFYAIIIINIKKNRNENSVWAAALSMKSLMRFFQQSPNGKLRHMYRQSNIDRADANGGEQTTSTKE